MAIERIPRNANGTRPDWLPNALLYVSLASFMAYVVNSFAISGFLREVARLFRKFVL